MRLDYAEWHRKTGRFPDSLSSGNLLSAINVGPGCLFSFNLAPVFASNMGIARERQRSPDGGTFSFSAGYGITNEFLTLGAAIGTSSLGSAFTINRFSNPNSLCLGIDCGVDRNDIANGAYAVYSLNKTRHLVSAITPTVFHTMRVHRLISLTAALFIPQASLSEQRLEIEMGFDSEIEAARAASDMYNPISIVEDREFMGAILKQGSNYGYTVTSGGRRTDRIKVKIDRENWQQTIGLWHTHGAQKSTHRYFSSTDTRTAARLNLPFFLADYTGYLKVYRPGDATLSPFVARRLGLDFKPGYAIGQYVNGKYERPIRIRIRDKVPCLIR